MFEKIQDNNRPAYFYETDYDPDIQNANDGFTSINVISDYIPNIRNWIYDQLEFNALSRMRDAGRKDEIDALINTARKYDDTTSDKDPYFTVVTQLYICELLVKLLIAFIGNESTPKGHGYGTPSNFSSIADLKSKLKGDGVALALHRIFYDQPLLADSTGELPSLKEYMRFIPEIRIELSVQIKEPSFVIEYDENFGSGISGHHDNGDEAYHRVNHRIGDKLKLLYPTELKDPELFPELTQLYTIGRFYANKPVSQLLKADEMISFTRDVDGTSYALGFGKSDLCKQRDIEIRYYIMFILGSLGRYSPEVWNNLKAKDPLWYYFIRRFLEHNQVLFPLLVLRYLTGKGYNIASRSVLS